MKYEETANEKVELIARQASKGTNWCCGDAYFFITTDEYFLCVLADGLGSGEFANEAATAVTSIVKENYHLPVEELIEKCNRILVAKRGAAVAIFKVMFEEQQFQYISIGNIRFFLYNPSIKKIIYPLPVSGYLSGRMRKFKVQTFPYSPLSKFVFFSDGLELGSIKSYISSDTSLGAMSEKIWNANTAQSDDVTFIIGSLLQ
ncbi:MAG: PP2C family serine/threonine-protein phosphatase [Bacillus sp. (in: firmicutes)]